MWTQASRPEGRRSGRFRIIKEVAQRTSVAAGETLCVHRWRAQDQRPERVLVFFHGALSHGARHGEMFEWLIQRSQGNLEVRALDLLGHGLSSGTRSHVAKFSHWTEDALGLVREVAETSAAVTVLGHSLGGLIALKLAIDHEAQLPTAVRGLALSNPCVKPIQVVDFPHAETVLNTVADKMPSLRYPRFHKGLQLVSDPEAANAFETDPLVSHFITAQMTREIWYGSQELRGLSYFLRRPSLFLLSDEDYVVDREASLLFSRGIDRRLVQVIEYSNARHELLHEKARQQVWSDLASWMEKL